MNENEGIGGIRQDTSAMPITKVDEALLKIGVELQDKEKLEEYYKQLKGVLILDVSTASHAGMILDLNSLPTEPVNIKEVFIKWLIEVNMPRIEAKQPPIVTYSMIVRCPLWKLISPPLKRLSLTKEEMFGQPKPSGSFGRGPRVRSINKK